MAYRGFARRRRFRRRYRRYGRRRFFRRYPNRKVVKVQKLQAKAFVRPINNDVVLIPVADRLSGPELSRRLDSWQNLLSGLQCIIPNLQDLPYCGPEPIINNEGSFLFFDSTVFASAMFAKWIVTNDFESIDTDPTVGKMDIDRIELEKNFRLYNSHYVSSITLEFRRRGARFSGQFVPQANYQIVGGQIVAAPDGAGTTTYNNVHVNSVSTSQYPTAVEQPFYIKAMEDIVSGENVYDWVHDADGFPYPNNFAISGVDIVDDPIVGTSILQRQKRFLRLLNEIPSGKAGWNKVDASKGFSLSLGTRFNDGSNLYYERPGLGTNQVQLTVRDPETRFDNSAFGKTGQMGARIADFLTYIADADQASFILPGRYVPRGSYVIFCPLDIRNIELFYDIYVSGNICFGNYGDSVLNWRGKGVYDNGV